MKKSPPTDKPVALALFALAGGVFLMALIGAITRLTESGLSIMEWAPLSGALPPLSEADWQSLYALYQQSGEFRAQPTPPTMDEFRAIFWWEWIHRQWGRLLGLGLCGVVLWCWRSGRLTRQLAVRCGRMPDTALVRLLAVLLLLGMVQAGVGWWMVASGFADRTDVAPIRLTFHLILALVIYALLVVAGLGRSSWYRVLVDRVQSGMQSGVQSRQAGALRLLWRGYLGVLFLLIASGALVAGSNAGLVYNTWPLMDGSFVPIDYQAPGAPSFLANLIENPSAIQFHHRWLAAVVAFLTLILSVGSWRKMRSYSPSRGVILCLFAPSLVVLLQFVTGITTLLLVVPIWLAVMHQALALLLLTATLVALGLFTHHTTQEGNGAGDGNRTHDT